MKIIAELEQKKIFWGKRLFLLGDDGTLQTSCTTLNQSTSKTVILANINPKPRRETNREIWLFITFIVLTLAALCSITLAIFSEDESTQTGFYVLGLPLSILAFIGGVAFKKRSYDLTLLDFFSNEQSLVMYHESPTKEQYEAFIEQLQEQIKTHQNSIPEDGSMANQLRSLALLFADGTLTEPEFISAKKQIIDGNTPKGPIGFAQ